MGALSIVMALALIVSVLLPVTGRSQGVDNGPEFPVVAEILADDPFGACEGIAFNGEGRLFASCNRALWEIGDNGDVHQVAELHTNLGVAAIGERDLLVADFGPTNAFRQDRNSDGIVWKITPEGGKEVHSSGFGDPNFVLVREDGSYLVSDDATADIYVVDTDRATRLFTTAVSHPNGLALSADGSVLYVAQIFSNIRPVVGDSRIWAIRLAEGKPVRDAKLVVRTGPGGAPDGLAMDSDGRLYIASNMEGKVWRFDPANEEMLVITEGVFGAASLAFGAGEFDEKSLYVTATFSQGRGGKIYRVPVGATAGVLYR